MRFVVTALLALVFTSSAFAADTLDLAVVQETEATITFSWSPPAAANSYKFFVGGKQVANSQSGLKSSVKFAKASCDADPDCYIVVWSTEGGRGGWKKAPACSNSRDDDRDTKIDYPEDPGCTSATDTDEADLAPPPVPPGPTTLTPAQFASACNNGGTVQNATVTGSVDLSATQNCHALNVTFQGTIKMGNGTTITGSRASGFYAFGVDNWVIDQSYFDGHGDVSQNLIWDQPAGVTPDNWQITNSTFVNFYDASDSSTHSEALYVGYSTKGLIAGNTFENNGNTSHVFFTNFGNQFNGSSYPRNICVRGNTFGATHGAFFDVNFHQNVSSVGPAVTNIRIDPDNVMPHGVTNPEFLGDC